MRQSGIFYVFIISGYIQKVNLLTSYIFFMGKFMKNAYMAAIVAGMLLNGCAMEELHTRAMSASENNLEVTTNVDDHLGGSETTFDLSSTIDPTGDGTEVMRFEPEAYLNVVLEKEHIEVADASLLFPMVRLPLFRMDGGMTRPWLPETRIMRLMWKSPRWFIPILQKKTLQVTIIQLLWSSPLLGRRITLAKLRPEPLP